MSNIYFLNGLKKHLPMHFTKNKISNNIFKLNLIVCQKLEHNTNFFKYLFLIKNQLLLLQDIVILLLLTKKVAMCTLLSLKKDCLNVFV